MRQDDDWTDGDTAALVHALTQAGDQPAGRFIRDKLERKDLSDDEARSFIRAVESAAERAPLQIATQSLQRLR